MIPVHLRISGFLSYNEPVDLDFSGFDLACITGTNGAGKSSLLDAMTWALFGQARRRDDSLLNTRSEAAEVIFEFSYERNLFRVQRSKRKGRTTQLEFYVRDPSEEKWSTLTEATLRETEAQIEQTLRLDYETFTNASFFLQGKADQFAQQRSGDRKRILGSILGLDVWESYREKASEKRRSLDAEVNALEQRLEEIHKELQQEAPRRERLRELEEKQKQLSKTRETQQKLLDEVRRRLAGLERQRTQVDTMAGQIEKISERMAGSEEELAGRNADREAYEKRLDSAAEIEKAYQAWQDKKEELARWESVAADFRQHDAQSSAPRLEIETERTRLDQERQTLVREKEKLSAEEEQLSVLQDKCQVALAEAGELEQKAVQRSALEEELNTFQERRGEAGAENKHLRTEMKSLRERIDRLLEAGGGDCPLCGQELSAEDHQALVARLEAEGKQLGDRFRENNELVRQGDEKKAALDRQLAEYSQVESILRQKQRQVDQLTDHQTRIREQAAAWQLDGAKRLQEVDRRLTEEDYAHDARKELTRINEALKELGYDAAAHDLVRKEEQAGRESEEHSRQLETARANLGSLEETIAFLQKQLGEQREDLLQQEKQYQDAKAQFEQDAAEIPEVNQVEEDFFKIEEEVNQLFMEIGGARQEVEVLDGLRRRAAAIENERDDISLVISRMKMLERAFSKDGIPALLIEQALPEIEEQANDILDRLTGGDMSVRFETQKEYKDKKRVDKKETLDILISDSAGTREYEMFSGGEAFRVNFAIRLALSEVLAKRAGARLQMLVIDEGFGSQDAVGRQRLVEVINMIRSDFEKVLVITHLEDLKDVFQARIEVEKTGQGSQLQVVL